MSNPSLDEIYTAVGIEVREKPSNGRVYALYAGRKIDDRKYSNQGHRKYGYCFGTDEIARKRRLEVIRTSKQSSSFSSDRSPKENSQPSSGTSTAFAEINKKFQALDARQELHEKTQRIEVWTDIRSLRGKALECCGKAETAQIKGDNDQELHFLCQAKAIYKDLERRGNTDVSRELGEIEERLSDIRRSIQASRQVQSLPLSGNPNRFHPRWQTGREKTPSNVQPPQPR